MTATNLQLEVGQSVGSVSACFQAPGDFSAIFAFAHGAGANMGHAFMQSLSDELGALGIATLRYNFPYMEAGRKRPDVPAVLEATVRAAIDKAAELAGGKAVIAGGKSMGGRMTSQALSKRPDERVRGVVFVGFPLHQPGKPSTDRAAHLADVGVPMLFLQGTRDSLAKTELIEEVCASLGARATLHIIPTADHSFVVQKSSGRSNDQVKSDLANIIRSWLLTLP